MKQIEITVRLNERMQEAIRKLEMQGFEKIRESEIDDIYMTSKLKELNENNIQNILKKSVLLRSLNGVRIDIWTHFMRGCIIDYVH